jgi:sulfide:quinone oxidoreductase
MSDGATARPLEVVIVGGGVAGLETVMALRAVAGGRVAITLVTPEDEFVYRPLSVGEPFGLGAPLRHPLDQVARDFDVELVHDELEWVATQGERVFTRGGDEIAYDALVLAMGARREPAWDHVLTFGGPRDSEAMRALVDEVERGEVASVAFVVPEGVTWPLPLYELALLLAKRTSEKGLDADLAVFTPEREPLHIFGRDASRDVAGQLEAAGVRVARGAKVEVTPDGDLVTPHEEWPLRFERVVAVPRLHGPAPHGIPHDGDGFIPIDAHGMVHGVQHVYAAGDGTTYPVKHGGIASQQADAVAELIAKRAGAGIEPRPFRPVLRAQLLTGGDPRYLRADLSSRATEHSQASETPLWWPVAKIAGAHLAPYLAAQEGVASPPQEEEATEALVFLPSHFEDNPWGE